MKLTLDHNCIIHLENRTEIGEMVAAIVHAARNECYVVNIGASEMRKGGVLPDHYEAFERLLERAGIADLPRLDPLLIWDVTFWDRSLWADEPLERLSAEIERALFGDVLAPNSGSARLDSTEGKKWLNRVCDAQGMWCHIHNRHDVFLTTDRNFTKPAKLARLLELGARRICHPEQF